MSLKIYSHKQEKISEESGWEDYHNDFQIIEKQLALRKIAFSTKIISDHLPKNRKVLDAGCGIGGFLLSFKNVYENRYIGVDFSISALKTLRRYDESQLVVKSNVLNLPFSESSFDMVVSLGVVEHFEDGPVDALKECYRVLKPGGMLICSVPFANLIRHLIYPVYRVAFRYLFGKTKNFSEYRYTKREMVIFCQTAGFKVSKTFYVDLEPNNFSYFWFVDFGPCFKKNAGQPFELNRAGKAVKSVLAPFPFLQAGGIMIICEKNDEAESV